MAIETLRKGMTVLAENPATGKVEAEPVLRLIVDHVSPLLEVDLSDGTVLKVTADHPFWVDSGADLAKAGWLHAEHLRAGDQLRTAKGNDVVVVRVRRNVGHAVVYTLTVAHDHTSFVGAARVLVHNQDFTACPAGFANQDQFKEFGSVIHQELDGLVDYHEAYISGSSATGSGYHSGQPFGPHSDIDVSIVSKELFDTIAHDNPAAIRGGGRTGPNPNETLLGPLMKKLSSFVGRDVNIAVYETRGALNAYHGEGNSIPIP